jgi:hypothetical protein
MNPTLTKMKLTALLICLLAVPMLDAQTAPSGAKPLSATVVNPPAGLADEGVGDIQVAFSDGHKEVLTKGDKCGRPHISAKGDIGWNVWGPPDKSPYQHSSEVLRVRLPDGTTKDFKPNSRFIMDWNFVDDASAVVIASMGFHGSQFYVKYDLATGKVKGKIDDYVPYADLPKWAQPFSDEKP